MERKSFLKRLASLPLIGCLPFVNVESDADDFINQKIEHFRRVFGKIDPSTTMLPSGNFGIDTSIDWLNEHPENWDGYTLGFMINDEIVPVETIHIQERFYNGLEQIDVVLSVGRVPYMLPIERSRLESVLNEFMDSEEYEIKLNLVYGMQFTMPGPNIGKLVDINKVSKNVEFSDVGIAGFTMTESYVGCTFTCNVENVENKPPTEDWHRIVYDEERGFYLEKVDVKL